MTYNVSQTRITYSIFDMKTWVFLKLSKRIVKEKILKVSNGNPVTCVDSRQISLSSTNAANTRPDKSSLLGRLRAVRYESVGIKQPKT